MKKLFTLCSILLLGAVNVFAQEEDVTHYIVNAGFDEDLTFNADGSYKEGTGPNAEKETLSGRSWSYVHPDGSCFAHTDSRSTNWKGTDGRTWATNGYVGQIKGWECTRTDYPACEWVYFGVLPYDLAPNAIPVADDGTTYQPVPAKNPAAGEDNEENKGALFLRAGWGGKCSYKQVVNLPCAEYRLEYWTININTNSTATATDLSKVTCRKDVFQEEGGSLSATEWTKHEFTFTPTSEFTVEFGYQSANSGSGGQPYVFIDGIKLYKVGEADKEALLQSDLADLMDSLSILCADERVLTYESLSLEIGDKMMEFEEASTEEEYEASIKAAKEYIQKVNDILPVLDELAALDAKAQKVMESENPYPGQTAFAEKYETLLDEIAECTTDNVSTIVEQLNTALNEYYFSQEVTEGNPAEYTFLIKNPWFIKADAEPTIQDGVLVYPNGADYVAGTGPEDGTSDGWYKGSVQSGDQRINFAQGRVCWNLWDNAAGSHAISQDLTNIPNGYYTVSADMITQPDWVHEAHVYAKTSAYDVSSPFLSTGDWTDTNDGVWTTLTTEKIMVADGKLTIGGRSQFPEGNQRGWFCITNVRLFYHGELKVEDYIELYNSKIAEAQAMCDTMVYAADKVAFAAAIEKSKGATTIEEINASLDSLSAARSTAQASIDKWIGVNTGSWANLKDSIAADVYSAEAVKVAQKIVDLMAAKIYAEDATYTTMDALTAILRKYRDSYIPKLMATQALTYTSAKAQEVITSTIAQEVSELEAITEFPTAEVMDAYVALLDNAINEANKIELYATTELVAGTDMTGIIVNPTIDDTYATGWTVVKTNADGNGAKSGQQFDGNANGFYIDSYNGTPGAVIYTASQTLNVPNGTYVVKAMTRTSGNGAYLFAIAGTDTTNAVFAQMKNHEINYTKDVDPTILNAEGGDSIAVVGDKFGPIWAESAQWINQNLGIELLVDSETGTTVEDRILEWLEGYVPTDEQKYHLDVVAANAGQGRGWSWREVEVTVTDHALTIGVTTDSIFTVGHKDNEGVDCVPFNGTWFSADNFTLTLKAVGDNTGWDPTVTGIESVVTPENVAVRVENGAIIANGEIYSISGSRVANGTKVPAGVYIVRQGKTAKKVLVK